MTFRLVAFDIDGTLLGSDRQLQPGTRLGLEAIREAGAQIMLASGRPIPGLKQLAEKLEIGEDLILAGMNGSIIVDQASGRSSPAGRSTPRPRRRSSTTCSRAA